MYYYFFITSEELRDGVMKPTLRALPGQIFPDGTPVDTDLNVQAPKEKGTSMNGCRLEYPFGTVFCSSFLTVITTMAGNKFYSVYDSSKGQGPGKGDPDFFPVSADPKFPYVSPGHINKKMNAAYVNFNFCGEQGDGADEPDAANPPTPKKMNTTMTYTPSDKDGKARPPIAGWTQRYDDQVRTEAEITATWMMRLLRDMSITMTAKRPKVDQASLPLFEYLCSCGESADTIASRTRFYEIMSAEKMDQGSLQVISSGPFEWYLERLKAEHERGRDCTAVRRSPDAAADLDDAAFMLSQGLNRQTGVLSAYDTPEVKSELKKALEAGWTLDDILVPEVLTAKPDMASLTKALSSGLIPLPEKEGYGSGTSYIDTLMKLKQNECPKDKDGFHVDKLTWKLLVLNLNRKKNTLLIGPTGSGKTVLVQKLCEQTGTPFTIIQMGAVTDPTEQLVGKMDIVSNPNSPKPETEFDWADFALAVQRPGVVLLDEVNRIPRNGYNILFGVLDGTRVLQAGGAKGTDKRTIPVHPDCVFFATANIGLEYTATDEIDAAFRNRFRTVELDYLDVKTETSILMHRTGIGREDAQNIAIVAKDIRDNCRNNAGLRHAVSTRETLECASYVRDGLDVEEAMEVTFLPEFEMGRGRNDPASERGIVKSMIAKRFNN